MRLVLALLLTAAGCSGETAQIGDLPDASPTDSGHLQSPHKDAGEDAAPGDASPMDATFDVSRDAEGLDACVPSVSCASANADCGTIDNGCGHALSCGACASPKTCGGGGFANRCGCQPAPCSSGECGTVPTTCGDKQCGACAARLQCGGGGVAYHCGNFFDECTGTPTSFNTQCVIDLTVGGPSSPRYCAPSAVQQGYTLQSCMTISSSQCSNAIGCYF